MLKDTKKVDWIYIWSLCNAECTFCIDKQTIWSKKIKSIDYIKAKIDKFYTEWIVECIIYEWWDFSIYPYIWEILEYWIKKWFVQTFQTNWILLSNIEFVRKLKFFNINIINFSLHSLKKEKYNRIMWTKWKTLDKVIKWIFNCNKVWIDVNLNFVIIKDNIDEMINMYLLFTKLKINQISFIMYIPPRTFSSKDNRSLTPNPLHVWNNLNKIFDLSNYYSKKWLKVLPKIKIHNIPFCLINNNSNNIEISYFRRARRKIYTNNQKFYFSDKCKECIKYNQCSWITKYYVDVFWDDYLKPIL